MNSIKTKIAGVSFGKRQNIAKGLNEGELLILAREYQNEFDENAVMVLRSDNKQLGYLNKNIAADVGPALDKGLEFTCNVLSITGLDKELKGVNIEIKRLDEKSESCSTCGRKQENKEDADKCCK